MNEKNANNTLYCVRIINFGAFYTTKSVIYYLIYIITQNTLLK